jgi:hypothetical protein
MKRLIGSAMFYSVLFIPVLAIADHIVFGETIIDRSQVVITLHVTRDGNNDAAVVEAEAVYGTGAAAKTMNYKCRESEKMSSDLYYRIAKHLDSVNITNFEETLAKAGLVECK